MSNQLRDLLSAWYPRRDEDWVLGTVYQTAGSAYRKAGAFMLIDHIGQQYGVLSGGCLADLPASYGTNVLKQFEKQLISANNVGM